MPGVVRVGSLIGIFNTVTLYTDCFLTFSRSFSFFCVSDCYDYSKARFKRRILDVPNLMQMSENNRFLSFALDSAHVKCDV